LRLFPSEEALEKELQELLAHGHHLGLVSLEAPLISNLSVLENISLLRQYHQRLSRRQAEDLTREYLRIFQMEDLAGKRNPVLDENQRFCVMVLRAVMVDNPVLVLDRPFKIMPDLADARFIYDVVGKVEGRYRECLILDYLWNEGRYAGGFSHEA